MAIGWMSAEKAVLTYLLRPSSSGKKRSITNAYTITVSRVGYWLSYSCAMLTVSAEAQAYVHSLELVEELAQQHRQKTWNVDRLSELSSYQAKLWEQFGSSRRQKPEYYRVVSGPGDGVDDPS